MRPRLGLWPEGRKLLLTSPANVAECSTRNQGPLQACPPALDEPSGSASFVGQVPA